MGQLTRGAMIKIARRWLENTGCKVIATELSSSAIEKPDVVGWRTSGRCIVVQCEKSRGDFLANKKRYHHLTSDGVGMENWILVPENVIEIDELPEGWGFLEYRVTAGASRSWMVKTMVHAPSVLRTEKATKEEKKMLISVAWRALKAMEMVKPLGMGFDSEFSSESRPY